MREVKVGETVTDHFPVFEDDGYTKHSGLTASDFSVTSYLDSVPLALTVSVFEIGSSGEYKIQFIPVVSGLYSLQVLCFFHNEIWVGEYAALIELPEEVLDSIAFDLGIVKGLLHHNAMLDRQTYSNSMLTSARLRAFDSPANVPAVEGGEETTGLVAAFQIAAAYDVSGLNVKYTLKRTYP